MGLKGVFFALVSAISVAQGAFSCAEALLPFGSFLDFESEKIHFRLFSKNAERVELLLFPWAQCEPAYSVVLSRDPSGAWQGDVNFATLRAKGLYGPSSKYEKPIYYGYRLWGPNWHYSDDWRPGSDEGFLSDCDANGNRFNPNKVVFDPYARELSHDPSESVDKQPAVFLSGLRHRLMDSAKAAPKGVVVAEPRPSLHSQLHRPLKHEVIYELHIRGFTMQDLSVPAEERGTFRGAARKAKYLKDMGFSAVSLLPVLEYQGHDNYWGYMTLGFFALERKYATRAAQARPGGIGEEFQEMVASFHAAGIKVYVDDVFNHTGEGGEDPVHKEANLFSFRGIDNSVYYQSAGSQYQDNNGCGPNFNCAHPVVQNLVLDSMKYFRQVYRIDGFRLDLASVLGNTVSSGHGFHFDKMAPQNILNRAIAELPGADLIAEPWGVGDGTYQLGGFPYHPHRRSGWAEWNGKFRDQIRRSLNRYGVDSITPGQMAQRLAGSEDIFKGNGRKPWHSVNFITAHDGFTLWDLFSYNHPNNNQSPPYGPSPGGEANNLSWDQAVGGETGAQTQARRRQAARTAMALNVLSLGIPMVVAGDEFLRTQRGNNNPWNLDTEASWVDWTLEQQNKNFLEFTRGLLALRRDTSALTPDEYLTGEPKRRDSIRDLAWYQANGMSAEDRDLPSSERGYMDDDSKSFLGWRLDTAGDRGTGESSLYFGYNWGVDAKEVTLPSPRLGYGWYWLGDTHSDYESVGNYLGPGAAHLLHGPIYKIKARSLAIFEERRLAQ